MANEITQVGAIKVFLTGADNAVGHATTRQLSAAGYRVVSATVGTQGARHVRADGGIPAYPDLLRAGELRSAMLAAEADVVINLAPQDANHATPGGAHWDARLLTEGTAALVEASTAAGVKFIIHASYVFAGSDDESAESLIDVARTGEQLVLGGSVPACVLRFGFVYGADSPELIALRNRLKMGRSVPGGNPHAHAHWIYAEDAAEAVMLAAQKQPAGAILTVVDGQPASPVEFMGYFAETQGFSRPASGSRPDLRALLLGETPVDVSALHVHANSADAQSLLDWTPRHKDYHQGIDDLLLSWRAIGA